MVLTRERIDLETQNPETQMMSLNNVMYCIVFFIKFCIQSLNKIWQFAVYMATEIMIQSEVKQQTETSKDQCAENSNYKLKQNKRFENEYNCEISNESHRPFFGFEDEVRNANPLTGKSRFVNINPGQRFDFSQSHFKNNTDLSSEIWSENRNHLKKNLPYAKVGMQTEHNLQDVKRHNAGSNKSPTYTYDSSWSFWKISVQQVHKKYADMQENHFIRKIITEHQKISSVAEYQKISIVAEHQKISPVAEHQKIPFSIANKNIPSAIAENKWTSSDIVKHQNIPSSTAEHQKISFAMKEHQKIPYVNANLQKVPTTTADKSKRDSSSTCFPTHYKQADYQRNKVKKYSNNKYYFSKCYRKDLVQKEYTKRDSLRTWNNFKRNSHHRDYNTKQLPTGQNGHAFLSDVRNEEINFKVIGQDGNTELILRVPTEQLFAIKRNYIKARNLVPDPETAVKVVPYTASAVAILLRFMFCASYTFPNWDIALEVYAIAKKHGLDNLLESCQSYFEHKKPSSHETPRIVQLALHWKIGEVLDKYRVVYAEQSLALHSQTEFGIENMSCSIFCNIFQLPSEFLIPLTYVKERGLVGTRQSDIRNDITFTSVSGTFCLTGIQIRLEPEKGNSEKELHIFCDAFKHKQNVFEVECDKKLQSLVTLDFNSELVVNCKEEIKISVLIEDISLRWCYTLNNERLESSTRGGKFYASFASDKKTETRHSLFFIEKLFYTVE